MWLDVEGLDNFYKQPLGRLAQRQIAQLIALYWQPEGKTLLGYGYASPYLSPFLTTDTKHNTGLNPWQHNQARKTAPMGQARADKVLNFMPAAQGVQAWPNLDSHQPSSQTGPAHKNRTALVEEYKLPLADQAVDRVLLIHGLEHCDQPDLLMAEIWRVLSPQGRLLLVVPARRGLWVRSDQTPFGFGHPYSRLQIQKLASQHGFLLGAERRTLYTPPWTAKGLRLFAPVVARMLARFLPRLGGVIMIEAEKSYQMARPLRRVKTRQQFILDPSLAPQPTGAGGYTRKAQ